MRRLPWHVICLLCLLLLALFGPGVDSWAYTELLTNPGFESGITDWNKDPGTATIGTTTSPRSGTYAGYITKINSTTGAVDLYQDVTISQSGSGVYYTFKAYVLYPDSLATIFNNVRLRLAWYDSSSTLLRTDEGTNASTNASYQLLTLTKESPNGAARVRVMLHLNIVVGQSDLTNLVRWDDTTLYRSTANAITLLSLTAASPLPAALPILGLVALGGLAAVAALGIGAVLVKRRRE